MRPLSPMARSNAGDFALQLDEEVYRLSNEQLSFHCDERRRVSQKVANARRRLIGEESPEIGGDLCTGDRPSRERLGDDGDGVLLHVREEIERVLREVRPKPELRL